jgi:tRNA(Ile)-lysidine synthase TilS/MesJ
MDWIQINPHLFSSFPPDSRYLVGVSGGRDSIVLLDACSIWVIAD